MQHVRQRAETIIAPENLDRFDPLTMSHWTLPMVLTWIIWRDLERVRVSANCMTIIFAMRTDGKTLATKRLRDSAERLKHRT